ncbi:polysaccharide deacetylase family protein [Moorena bouillonii]|nr:polysaccharide deacetylase family protein [Moorena bouillonii]
MAKREGLFWSRSTWIIIAAILSCMAGYTLKTSRWANQNIAALITRQMPQQQTDSKKVETLTKPPDKGLQQGIAKWAEQERGKQINYVPPQFRGKYIEDVELKTPQKVIALTFDDGPWPKMTNDVLHILKKYDVKATFFVVGRNVYLYPEELKKIVDHGHALGNHSWNHSYYYHNSLAAAKEIDNTTARIYKTINVKTSLFRPPGGIMNNGLVAYARKKNYVIVKWSADSEDYSVNQRRLTYNVLRRAKPGGIVLLHDGGGNRAKTIRALPVIITELRKQGYQFVTVPELLDMARKELEIAQKEQK